MSDDDVLKRHTSVTSVDTEMNEFSALMTELVKVRPAVYQNADSLMRQAEISKDNLKAVRVTYLDSLSREVDARDLTVQKLKNASTMIVEIPKFKDYSSTLDFYTFKADFEKFVAPHF